MHYGDLAAQCSALLTMKYLTYTTGMVLSFFRCSQHLVSSDTLFTFRVDCNFQFAKSQQPDLDFICPFHGLLIGERSTVTSRTTTNSDVAFTYQRGNDFSCVIDHTQTWGIELLYFFAENPFLILHTTYYVRNVLQIGGGACKTYLLTLRSASNTITTTYYTRYCSVTKLS